MMKMLDKFMLLVADCETYKESRSPIKKWKILHRKHEIIKEIKSKEYFTLEDLCNYGWIIRWAEKKWNNDFYLPNGFTIRGVDNFYFYEYKGEKKTLFCISAKQFKSISEVQIDIHRYNNGDVTILRSNDGIHVDGWDLEWIQEIMREFIIGTISSILSRIIRGD